jgi:hypothetical protein
MDPISIAVGAIISGIIKLCDDKDDKDDKDKDDKDDKDDNRSHNPFCDDYKPNSLDTLT